MVSLTQRLTLSRSRHAVCDSTTSRGCDVPPRRNLKGLPSSLEKWDTEFGTSWDIWRLVRAELISPIPTWERIGRLSTDGQTLAAQDAALRAAGCAKVFAEKASGAKTDRAELRKVVSRLGEGDVLMVTRLDRLARSTRDLLNTLTRSPNLAPASSRSAICGATRPRRTAGLATFERHLIRARTSEGQARAKAAGVHMGRPPKLTPHQRREAIARRDAGETLSDIGRTYGVSHTTIGRL
jgi:hypothetical protein